MFTYRKMHTYLLYKISITKHTFNIFIIIHIIKIIHTLIFPLIISYKKIKNSEEKESFTVNNTITCTSTFTISKHTKPVSSLLLLKDNRISSCSYDNSISIFDPSNNFNCDMTLLGHSDLIFSICQLEDSRLVSCSHDCEIKIWDISKTSYQCAVTIKKAHDAHIFNQ